MNIHEYAMFASMGNYSANNNASLIAKIIITFILILSCVALMYTIRIHYPIQAYIKDDKHRRLYRIAFGSINSYNSDGTPKWYMKYIIIALFTIVIVSAWLLIK